jgi:hypothetical protein
VNSLEPGGSSGVFSSGARRPWSHRV